MSLLKNDLYKLQRKELRLLEKEDKLKVWSKFFKEDLAEYSVRNLLAKYHNKSQKGFTLKTISPQTNQAIPIYLIADLQIRDLTGKRLTQAIFNHFYTDIKANKHNVVTIAMLGDDIEGSIKFSSIVSNKLSSTEQAVNVAEWISDGLLSLSKICKINFVFVTNSNHGEIRPLSTSRGELPKEQMGLIIRSLIMSKTISNLNIRHVGKYLDNGIVVFNKNLFCHGHQDFMKNIETYLLKYGTNLRFFVGHLHQILIKDLIGKNKLIQVPCAKDWHGNYEIDRGYDLNPRVMKYYEPNSLTRQYNEFHIDQRFKSINRPSRQK